MNDKKTLNEWLLKNPTIAKKINGKKLELEKIKKHPLFKYLLKPKKEYTQRDIDILSSEINSLEEHINTLKKNKSIQRYSDLINRIFEPDHFQGARNELENACYFLDRGYEVILEPPATQSGKMDIRVKLESRFINFECYGPKNNSDIVDKLPKGEFDYVRNSSFDAIRKLLDKVGEKQIIKGEPNIFLVDISKKKWDVEGKTIDLLVINELIKKLNFFENNSDYSALVVYDRDAGMKGPHRWVIQNPNPDAIKLTGKEIQEIGLKFE